MMVNAHIEVITEIVNREFGIQPGRITRMSNGICNEVYVVETGSREAVFRLNTEPRFMLGSHNNIPLFRSKGIQVPEILAEDYSKKTFPFAYQVQSKMLGRDINDVIDTLNDDELRAVAAEIANVFRQLSSVPNNGKFGVLWGDDRDLVDSWSAEVARVTKVVTGWGRRTGVLNARIENILSRINSEYKDYFDGVRPYTYFGDICAKNVMIHEKRFAGLVDLDSLAQGDPLEAVGRIKASWYGTRYGTVYSDAVMDALRLQKKQRQIVTMYALLNRTFWTLENGIQFNQNTSAKVDRVRESQDKNIVEALYAELQELSKPAAKAFERTPAQIDDPIPVAAPASVPVPIAEDANVPQDAAAATVPPPVKPPRKTRASTAKAEPLPMIAMPEGEPEIHAPEIDPEEILAELAAQPIEAAIQTDRLVQPSTQKIMLEASGLSKTYISDGVGFDALKNVDLRIHKGDCVAIVGKSGSGKSTLMHMLACLDIPTDGYVYVDGDETSTMSESEKNRLRNEKFGFVFQQFFLNGRDTVYENVVLPMRIRGAGDYEIATEADEALAAVGISDKSGKKAKDLSGGEKQRVCIARALITKPQVIFADEPTGNLDSNTGAAVETLLFDLNQNKGITLVIVTHDPDLAKRCSRIVEMKDGKIIAQHNREASRI